MKSRFFNSVTVNGLVLSAAAVIGAFYLRDGLYACGILVGSAWIFLNSFFLFSILETAMGPKKNQDPRKTTALLLVKFPVIYLTGFFILKSRFFPVLSIVTGLSVFMAAFLFTWIRFNMKNISGILNG